MNTIVIPCSNAYTTTVSMQPYEPFPDGSWVSMGAKKAKPVAKPKPVIESKYTEAEQAAYMVQVEAVVEVLKANKWKGFCQRDYKIQKEHNHDSDYILIADKYNYYFYLTVEDRRWVDIRIEDPLGERVHGFRLNFDTELDRVTYASRLLVEAVGKIIIALKELRKINTKSRVFIIDTILDDMQDGKS